MPRSRTLPVDAAGEFVASNRPASLADLVALQLAGIDVFHRLTRPGQSLQPSREARMDAVRADHISQRVRAAVVERTELGLTGAGGLLCWPTPVRAVLAVRHEWFRDTVRAALVRRGVEVVAQPDNGADALGVVIAEQPDLLLTEDKLAMISGVELVELARICAPATRAVGQVAYDDDIGPLLEAGAVTACTRRMRPDDVASTMVALLGATSALTSL